MTGHEAPDHLPENVRIVWSELIDTHSDPARIIGPAFDAYCGQVALLRDVQARISAEGPVVANAKGEPVPHPALAIMTKAQAEVRAWGDRFKPRQRH